MYKLRRVTKKESRIFGVCGGISKYIDPEMDPVVMRILWLALSCFSPFMIILYFALALALKREEIKEKEKVEPLFNTSIKFEDDEV